MHFVPIVCRTEAPLRVPLVMVLAESGVSAGDLVSDVGSVGEVGDSAGGRELLKNIKRVVYDDVGMTMQRCTTVLWRMPP